MDAKVRYEKLSGELVEISRYFHAKGWSLSTSSNYSARFKDNKFIITQSGKDKGSLTGKDLMLVNGEGHPLDPLLKSSAETLLHTDVYLHSPETGCVLHTHSPAATALTMAFPEMSFLKLSGYEMQKAFHGIRSHEEVLSIPIVPNNQDMPALLAGIGGQRSGFYHDYRCYIIRGHGIYTWASEIAAAKHQVEAVEFLLAVEMNRILLNNIGRKMK